MYSFLINLPRSVKRSLVLSVDLLLIPLCIWISFGLRFGFPVPSARVELYLPFIFAMVVVGLVAIGSARLQHIKLHAFDTRSILRIGLTALAMIVLTMIVSYTLGLRAPRSIPILFGSSFFIAAVSYRVFVVMALTYAGQKSGTTVTVAVYGAGSAGIQLISALRHSPEVRPVAIVDDNPALHGLVVAGLKVTSPKELEKLAKANRVQRVLVAMPSVPTVQQNKIVRRISEFGCEVQILPSYVDLMTQNEFANGLRTVHPDELLSREKVELDIPDVAKTYTGRTVMVTGAGGSIGSELCRQLLECGPHKIVLFENSEFALYKIEQDLGPLARQKRINLSIKLGSVTNSDRLAAVLNEQSVDIVIHAAAYKHVPMVEDNPLEGALNNVFGTHIVAQAAQKANVERFILVSTDKAVRPTNIMGATKRMAEIVVQDMQTHNPKTLFSMVRFGNVLGSSGSVLPLFERQIAAGGPVTVTHPEVTRFFMTIPEAARLVLLAGAFSEGGDVFVLDMGKPVKIIDIAHRMIKLAGMEVADPDNGEEGIEVAITGLRPGEKLYEELLISDENLRHTPHEKILRAQEDSLSQIEVASMLKELKRAISNDDVDLLQKAISKCVDGYHKQVVDIPAQ